MSSLKPTDESLAAVADDPSMSSSVADTATDASPSQNAARNQTEAQKQPAPSDQELAEAHSRASAATESADSKTTASESTSDNLANGQDWFLLSLLPESPNDGLTLNQIQRKAATQSAIGRFRFTAQAVTDRLAELIQQGFAERYLKARSPHFRSTATSAARLAELHELLNPPPPKLADLPEHLIHFHESLLLLHLLETDEGELSEGKANSKLQKQPARFLQLDQEFASYHREQLKRRGFISSRRHRNTEYFKITPNGKQFLNELHRKGVLETHQDTYRLILPEPEPKRPEDLCENMEHFHEALLLLHLLEADEEELSRAEADKKLKSQQAKDIGLRKDFAEYYRFRLRRRKFLEIRRADKLEYYRITPDGKDYLGSLDYFPVSVFKLRGRVLNKLLTIVRESQNRVKLRPDFQDSAVLEIFKKLLRERYGLTRKVPIHEIRKQIKESFGEYEASHEILDEILMKLWRQKLVQFVSLVDRSIASKQELQDSLVGDRESILFYMEPTNAD